MRREPSYPPEAKTRALAALLAGERPRAVARDHGIPFETVRTWRRRLRSGKMNPLKKGDGDLLAESLRRYLESSIETLEAHSRHLLANPEVVRGIPTVEIALKHGAEVDRTIRILELLPALGIHPPRDATP